MIRFMPDSWLDVVMRPLDMISPEGNIYVEVPAPDARMFAALLLALAVLVSSGRPRPDRRLALQLLGLTLLAMVLWLATTGNGRYFTAFLLLLGPLCVGLVRLLPLSASLKFSAVGLLLLVQGVLVFEASPWGTWTLLPWRDGPYFQVAAPPTEPRSYVTLSPISYSLVAPQFPKESRWMNLSAPVTGQREREYARKWLADARSLHLLAIAYPPQIETEGQPSRAVVDVFNHLMRPRGLSVAAGTRCEFLSSRGLAGIATRGRLIDDPDIMARFGFWLCPVRYDPAAAAPGPADSEAVHALSVDAVFEAVEKMCPRFFPAGQSQTQRLDGASTRHYMASDTRLFVLDDGEVMYKFWRSLNAVTIGSRENVLAGQVRMDCTKIRAPTWRSGGP